MAALSGGGRVLAGLRHNRGNGRGGSSPCGGRTLAARGDPAGRGPTQSTDSRSRSCCRRASRGALHAPHWPGDPARAQQPWRQAPGLERRRPEPAGGWAAAAAPWMRWERRGVRGCTRRGAQGRRTAPGAADPGARAGGGGWVPSDISLEGVWKGERRGGRLEIRVWRWIVQD